MIEAECQQYRTTRFVGSKPMRRPGEVARINETSQWRGISLNTWSKWAGEGQLRIRLYPGHDYRLSCHEDLEKFPSTIEDPAMILKKLKG